MQKIHISHTKASKSCCTECPVNLLAHGSPASHAKSAQPGRERYPTIIVLNVSFATTADDTHCDDTRIIPLPRRLIADIHAISPVSKHACSFGVPVWSLIFWPVWHSEFWQWFWDLKQDIGVADVTLKDLPANEAIEVTYR